jgi:hypothetical protein
VKRRRWGRCLCTIQAFLSLKHGTNQRPPHVAHLHIKWAYKKGIGNQIPNSTSIYFFKGQSKKKGKNAERYFERGTRAFLLIISNCLRNDQPSTFGLPILKTKAHSSIFFLLLCTNEKIPCKEKALNLPFPSWATWGSTHFNSLTLVILFFLIINWSSRWTGHSS